MKKWMVCLFVILAGLGVAQAENPWGIIGNINFQLGVKGLSESDWRPVENQTLFGAQADFRKSGWPVNILGEYLYSGSDDDDFLVDNEGGTFELGLGVRKYWENMGRWRLYLGAGPALLAARVENHNLLSNVLLEDDDTAIGFWAGGGVLYSVSEVLHFGINLRGSYGKVTLLRDDKNAGGIIVGLVGGVHFQ